MPAAATSHRRATDGTPTKKRKPKRGRPAFPVADRVTIRLVGLVTPTEAMAIRRARGSVDLSVWLRRVAVAAAESGAK